jgi:hypothetical protein
MQRSILKSSAIAAVGLLAFTLVGTASAQELVPNACQQTDPLADYVEITGGTTTCDPTTQFCCEINIGQGSCEAFEPGIFVPPEVPKQFRVHSEVLPNNGGLHWWLDTEFSTTFLDGYKTIGASGGSNCFYGHEPDQDEASGGGYVKNNGNYSGVQRAIFFSDGQNEFAEVPLPNVPNCELNGVAGKVADVQVMCPDPVEGYEEQGSNERWIIVAEVRNGHGVKNKNTMLGFIDPTTGDIDPTNFCKCNKGDVAGGEDQQCNPNIQPSTGPGDPGDPPDTEGPYAGLPACNLDEALPVPVVIELQNPTCVGAGSSRRCW